MASAWCSARLRGRSAWGPDLRHVLPERAHLRRRCGTASGAPARAPARGGAGPRSSSAPDPARASRARPCIRPAVPPRGPACPPARPGAAAGRTGRTGYRRRCCARDRRLISRIARRCRPQAHERRSGRPLARGQGVEPSRGARPPPAASRSVGHEHAAFQAKHVDPIRPWSCRRRPARPPGRASAGPRGCAPVRRGERSGPSARRRSGRPAPYR